MGKKLTEEEVISRFRNVHGDNMIEAWLQRSNIRYERQFVLINQEIDRPSHRLVIDFFVKHKGRQPNL